MGSTIYLILIYILNFMISLQYKYKHVLLNAKMCLVSYLNRLYPYDTVTKCLIRVEYEIKNTYSLKGLNPNEIEL
ncbi:hypothetical protein SAMN05216361_1503 [Marisediminitalea aggregata]|uniref:Uncharacterized protein n=1 Tax=Marisediminitalea aggregata TaxID=634436 RepID=A0A1M5HJZ4_9ALTE|nr:hypothetical protein SAMN05216361_1503 [Marisediminitalea aggregata]